MRNSRWALGAWLILLSCAVLSASQWAAYPYFLDSTYHLAVIEGFRQAGGPVLHCFWEAAPEGQPQLYPPLFHLLFLPARIAGLPSLFLARFWSSAAFPFLLLIAWLVFSRITSERQACLTLIALGIPYSFFLSTVNHLPATLALAAGLGLILCLHKNRWLAGGLLLGLSFWLHAGLPWLFLLSLILFGLFKPDAGKTVGAMIGIGLLAAGPWLIHLFRHLSTLEIRPRGEDLFLESPLILVALGLAGLKPAWDRQTANGRFLVALAAGFLPMGFLYPFRFFSAQGLFPLLLLSGVALEELFKKSSRAWPVGLGLLVLALGSPSLHWSMDKISWVWGDTPLSNLSGLVPGIPRPAQQHLFDEQFLGELADRIAARTEPEELITCNLAYTGGMLSVLTGRATTTTMLGELNGRSRQEQIAPAKLVIWLKDPEGRPSRELNQLTRRFRLKLVGETELAYLLDNPTGMGRRQIRRAAVPWWAALGLVILAVGGIVWDLKRG